MKKEIELLADWSRFLTHFYVRRKVSVQVVMVDSGYVTTFSHTFFKGDSIDYIMSIFEQYVIYCDSSTISYRVDKNDKRMYTPLVSFSKVLKGCDFNTWKSIILDNASLI